MTSITRTLRLHENGRTLLTWWQTYPGADHVDLPIRARPMEHFVISFPLDSKGNPVQGDVMINGILAYRFWENPNPPERDFHRIEFLYDASIFVIEYRRNEYGPRS